MVAPSHADRLYCGRVCMKAHYASGILKGENHWHWQGGITEKSCRDVLYPGYKDWRKAVYRRDGFACQVCGCTESGLLRAHHIKPRSGHPDLLLDINNGVTVCDACHKDIHYGSKEVLCLC